jgi:hypothetical protein
MGVAELSEASLDFSDRDLDLCTDCLGATQFSVIWL